MVFITFSQPNDSVFCVYIMLGIEPGALCTLDKYSTTELYPQPNFFNLILFTMCERVCGMYVMDAMACMWGPEDIYL